MSELVHMKGTIHQEMSFKNLRMIKAFFGLQDMKTLIHDIIS